MEIINNEKYYRTGEWSKMINRKRETISEWCTDGKLKSIKKGKFYIYIKIRVSLKYYFFERY